MTNKFMQIAIDMAKIAAENDEVPIGAIIVDPKTQEIISKAYNLSQHDLCCTGHAEMLAIEKACKKLGQNRLWGMDLYVTLEPCTMCAAAISFARIENLYFGAFDEKGGAVENGVKFYQSPTCHHKPNVVGGVMEDETSALLKDFFKNKRNKVK